MFERDNFYSFILTSPFQLLNQA